MTQRRAGAPSAKSRPAPKSASWPVFVGLALGLFLVSFYVGLNGMPFRSLAPRRPETPTPAVPPAPAMDDRQRVSVRELPVEERSIPPRPARRKEKAKRARPEDAPSPPAVSMPVGTARVQEDAPPAPAAPAGDSSPSGGSSSVDAGTAPAEAAPAPPPGGYKVQAGAYQEEENARRMADRLAASGYQPSVTTSKSPDGTLYRVQVGPFPERKAAENAVRDLGQQGIDARVGDE